MAFQITGVSGVCSGADKRKQQSYAGLWVTGLWEENQPVASNVEKCFHLMTSAWVVLSIVSSHVIQCYNSRDVFIPAIQQDCFTRTTTIAWLLLYQWSNPGWYGYSWPWQTHDDVIKWKHFPRYWPFVRGIHRSPVNSPHKGQWHGALMFSFICVRINGWVNNREVGDLRRYRNVQQWYRYLKGYLPITTPSTARHMKIYLVWYAHCCNVLGFVMVRLLVLPYSLFHRHSLGAFYLSS